MIKFTEEIEEEVLYSSINRRKLSISLDDVAVSVNKNLDEELQSLKNSYNLSDAEIEKLKKQKLLIEEINDLHDSIENLAIEITSKLDTVTKDFSLVVPIDNDPVVQKAVKKIFGKPLKSITYEMYKEAKEKLTSLNTSKVEEV